MPLPRLSSEFPRVVFWPICGHLSDNFFHCFVRCILRAKQWNISQRRGLRNLEDLEYSELSYFGLNRYFHSFLCSHKDTSVLVYFNSCEERGVVRSANII